MLYTLVSTLQRTAKILFPKRENYTDKSRHKQKKIKFYQQVASTLKDSRNTFFSLAFGETSMGPTYETSRITLPRSQ